MQSRLKRVGVSLLIVLALAACIDASSHAGPTASGDGFQSEVFDVQARSGVVAIGQDGHLVLEYSAVVENASDKALKNVNAQINTPEQLGQYLAAGGVPTPPTDFDLVSGSIEPSDVPEGGARGIEINSSPLLIDEEMQKMLDLQLSELLSDTYTMELTISWKGGSEAHTFEMAITDPDGLLGKS